MWLNNKPLFMLKLSSPLECVCSVGQFTIGMDESCQVCSKLGTTKKQYAPLCSRRTWVKKYNAERADKNGKHSNKIQWLAKKKTWSFGFVSLVLFVRKIIQIVLILIGFLFSLFLFICFFFVLIKMHDAPFTTP